MNDIKIKPCPLCGNDVEITTIERRGFCVKAKIECRCGLSFEHSRRELAYEKTSDNVPTGREIVGTGIFDEVDFVTAWNRRASDEVERWKAYNENLKAANAHVLGTLQDEIEKAKQETIKEFAERLKYEMQNIARVEIDGKIYFLVGEPFIDDIAEAMKEE